MKNEHNNLVGGYTTLPWKSRGEWRLDSREFVFSISQMRKFALIDEAYTKSAIYDDSNCGPSFGYYLLLKEPHERCACYNIQEGIKIL